ncbi:MAG TPA: Gp138 family membrane-puncturing spike protein [bacterium]|nr:Gp138 family membrane-puncturing spike protein [bacterium]
MGLPPKPTLASAVKYAIGKKVAGVHTAMPGLVTKYDAARQWANVQPCVMYKTDEDDDAVAMPELKNIPVVFPRTATTYLTLPVAKGDHVLLVFAERSIDDWLAGKADEAPVEPFDPRIHDFNDAFAVVGVFPVSVALEENDEDVRLGRQDDSAQANIRIRPNGDIVLETNGTILLGSESASNAIVPQPALATWVSELLQYLSDMATVVSPAVKGNGDPISSNPLFATASIMLEKLALFAQSTQEGGYGVINSKVRI